MNFSNISSHISKIAGSSRGFTVALFLVVFWALSGPLFNFSSTWQLFINTLTTVVTFLMVFLIQNTQNRDTKAMHLKLDELIRAVRGARELYMDAEELSDEELEKLHEESKSLHARYAKELEKRSNR